MKSVWASGRVPHFCWLRRDALAEQAAARHREQAVGRLPAGALVVLERVGEVGEPLQPLGAGGGQPEHQHADAAQVEHEQPGRGADHPEHPEHDREQHQRGAEVLLRHDQADDQPGDRDHRDQRVPPVAEQLLLAGVEVGAPQDHGELGQLGGLHLQRSEASQFWLPLVS